MKLFTDGKQLIIEFPYNPDTVSRVKTLPNRVFNPTTKQWIIPLTLNDFFAFRKLFPDAVIDKSVRDYDFNKEKTALLNYNPPAGLTPYKHQFETFRFMIQEKQAAVFNTMGTGKTITSLMVLDYLFKNNLIKKALIISPLLVMNAAWIADAERYFSHLKVNKLSKEQDEAEDGISIVNWDMVKILYDYIEYDDPVLRKRVKKPVKEFKFDFDCVILDESAKVRNISAKRFHILKRYLPVPYTYILSGLPAPNTPLEYWAQFYLMDGGKTLGVNYYKFLSDHAYKTKYDYIITKQGAHDIKEKILKKSIRFELEDCVDLPENVVSYREIELDNIHKSRYSDILEENIKLIDMGALNVSNAAVKTMKLQQAASGYIYNDEGQSIRIADKNKKIESLIEIIREDFGRNQVLVYVYFKNHIEAVFESLRKEFSVGIVYGGIDNRKQVEDFKAGRTRVLLANPASVGHGLTFTNAKGIIWFAPIWDYEIFEQARKRVQRIGLKHTSLEIFMYAKDTIEYAMYEALRTKKDMSDAVLRVIKNKNKRKKLEGIY